MQYCKERGILPYSLPGYELSLVSSVKKGIVKRRSASSQDAKKRLRRETNRRHLAEKRKMERRKMERRKMKRREMEEKRKRVEPEKPVGSLDGTSRAGLS